MPTKRPRWPRILLVLLALVLLGGFLADRSLKRHGHPGLVTFAGQWWHNYPKSFRVQPPHLAITVDKKGMAELDDVVERAREEGVIEQEGNDYVKARVHVDMPAGLGDSSDFKARLRIKGKMTDHVKGDKWSFRVIAKKEGSFLGMTHFSLQHPGTRNYLCDWFYHRLMRGEGIIALRYGFCTVELNNEDLGVYAYEEHFAPELLQNNDRIPGPIVRFDPSLFWRHRVAGIEGGPAVDDAYGAYQAAALDAYDSGGIAKDPVRKAQFEEAVAIMDAFRRGEKKASEVFDVDRIGRQLAIIDLIGGQHSMDWSDVKYWFDPQRKVFEPISYESFSANPTRELAGAYRFTGPFRESDDLHSALFKDPLIFAAYVHHLERVSRKAYLDSAFTALQGPLDTASAMLYAEFPYKELDRSVYYRNQEAIRRLLDTPKACHVYSEGFSGDTLTLTLVPVNALPITLDSLEFDGRLVALPHQTLPCRQRGKVGEAVRMRFVLPDVGHLPKKSWIAAHVPGSDRRLRAEVFPYAYRDRPVAVDSTAVKPSAPTPDQR